MDTCCEPIHADQFCTLHIAWCVYNPYSRDFSSQTCTGEKKKRPRQNYQASGRRPASWLTAYFPAMFRGHSPQPFLSLHRRWPELAACFRCSAWDHGEPPGLYIKFHEYPRGQLHRPVEWGWSQVLKADLLICMEGSWSIPIPNAAPVFVVSSCFSRLLHDGME